MPATTRSKTKQARLEDFDATTRGSTTKPKPKPETKGSTASKRKQNHDGDTKSHNRVSPAARKRKQKQESEPAAASDGDQKQSHITQSGDITASEAPEHKPIIINRAPVLQLWSACVAQKLYPNLSWPTCLAIGSAISTLCAISKGRSIGVMEPPDTADGERKEHKEAQKRRDEAGADDEVLVMGFRLLIKNEEVLLQGKPRRGSDGPLKAKFGGDDGYARVKDAMDRALASWTGRDEDLKELNKRAFHMYEAFRPSVQSGQGGWGRKGELSIDKIKEVVEQK